MNRMREENPDRLEPTARVVRALLILSPFLFAFCYFLALVQGASEQAAVVIGLGAFGIVPWRRRSQSTTRPESRRRSLAACHDHEADPVIMRASSPVSRWEAANRRNHATGPLKWGREP